MASKVMESNGFGSGSQVVIALQELDNMITLGSGESCDGDLFDHRVTVKTGNVTIDSADFDMEFDIPFDDDTEANESEIIVYNLSDTTIQNIKDKEQITVTAGYGDDMGIVLSGYISYSRTGPEDLDRATHIYVLDSEDRKEHDIENVAYGAGTLASAILRDLVAKVGLPVAVFSVARDYTYTDGQTINGGLMDAIKKQAQVCGVSAYICKSQIYVRPITEGDALSFKLSYDTGLISLEEFEETITAADFTDTVKGYTMKMLLQHRISTGAVITLDTRRVKGIFRVREGTHTYDGTDFITEVKAIECPPPAQPEMAEESKISGLPDLSSYSGVSIVDGLNSVGADSSFANRKKIAEQLGMNGYSGTADQNLSMLRQLGAHVG